MTDDNTPISADGTPENDPLAEIDPELIKELDEKTKEVVAEAIENGLIGALLDPDQIFPPSW